MAPAVHDEALEMSDPSFFTGAPPTPGSAGYETYEALANAQLAIIENMAMV